MNQRTKTWLSVLVILFAVGYIAEAGLPTMTVYSGATAGGSSNETIIVPSAMNMNSYLDVMFTGTPDVIEYSTDSFQLINCTLSGAVIVLDQLPVGDDRALRGAMTVGEEDVGDWHIVVRAKDTNHVAGDLKVRVADVTDDWATIGEGRPTLTSTYADYSYDFTIDSSMVGHILQIRLEKLNTNENTIYISYVALQGPVTVNPSVTLTNGQSYTYTGSLDVGETHSATGAARPLIRPTDGTQTATISTQTGNVEYSLDFNPRTFRAQVVDETNDTVYIEATILSSTTLTPLTTGQTDKVRLEVYSPSGLKIYDGIKSLEDYGTTKVFTLPMSMFSETQDRGDTPYLLYIQPYDPELGTWYGDTFVVSIQRMNGNLTVQDVQTEEQHIEGTPGYRAVQQTRLSTTGVIATVLRGWSNILAGFGLTSLAQQLRDWAFALEVAV